MASIFAAEDVVKKARSLQSMLTNGGHAGKQAYCYDEDRLSQMCLVLTRLLQRRRRIFQRIRLW